MILDIIIDPLTVLGDRWFLGRVYYYPHGGPYFGVPLTNFAGWFLVPCVVIVFNQLLWRVREPHMTQRVTPDGAPHFRQQPRHIHTLRPQSPIEGDAENGAVRRQDPPPSWLGMCFYCSIALFNIAITFWIGAWQIGLISLGWLCLATGPIWLRTLSRRTGGAWGFPRRWFRCRPGGARG